MGSKGGKYATYLMVNGYAHDLPGSFGQALANLESVHFYYGQRVGKNMVAPEGEQDRIQKLHLALLVEIENILTLYSQGKLHRPGVPDHVVDRTSRATNQPPALSEWTWE